MSLENWLSKGWLVRHRTSRQEITNLLNAARRDSVDCQAAGLSADWRLNIAHNSALLAATAALAACGYRTSREGHRYRLMQSLAHTIGADKNLISQLDVFRKKRNVGGYERAGLMSDHEADEMVCLAKQVRDLVAAWLRANHPTLMGG